MSNKSIEGLWKRVEKEVLSPDGDPNMRAGMRDFFFFGADSMFKLLSKKLDGAQKGKLTGKQLHEFLEGLVDEIEDFYAETSEDSISKANDNNAHH